jgi:hypothetical protein
MLGLNLLMRLGRGLLGGPVAGSGVLPASYYRHLTLAAMEADDYPGALNYLKWTNDPLLGQVLILRLRLLADRHRRQRQGIQKMLNNGLGAASREKCRTLLVEETRAVDLLEQYEAAAKEILRGGLGDFFVSGPPPSPQTPLPTPFKVGGTGFQPVLGDRGKGGLKPRFPGPKNA